VTHGFVHVGGVDVEPDNVGKTHAGGVQDGFQIVQGKRDLIAHVPRVLRVPVSVNGGLACADQVPVCSNEQFGSIVVKVQRPRLGIHGRSLHGLRVLVRNSGTTIQAQVSCHRGDRGDQATQPVIPPDREFKSAPRAAPETG